MSKPIVVHQDEYFLKGKQAARRGAKRLDNPYNMKSDKGHLWDDGYLSVLREARMYRNPRNTPDIPFQLM